MTSRLSAHNLSVGFSSGIIVKEIDATLERGEILVVAGPNGAGKSTLAKTIARLLAPLAGEVRLDDVNTQQMSNHEFARKIAYVRQMQGAATHLSVRQLISLGRNPHQKWWQWQTDVSDRAIVDQVIASTGLEGLQHKAVSSLSGGERQRTYIATALAQQPEFLILDEPTAFLDFKYQLELVALLRDLSAQKIGILTVLHDLNLTRQIASRVLLLQKNENAPGTVKALGASDDVLSAMNVREVFGVAVGTATDAERGRSFLYFDSLRTKSEDHKGQQI